MFQEEGRIFRNKKWQQQITSRRTWDSQGIEVQLGNGGDRTGEGVRGQCPVVRSCLYITEKTCGTDNIHVVDDMRTLSVEQVRDSGGLSRAMLKKVGRRRQIKEVFY